MNATAAAIFALTFVSEDAAVLGAAAMAAGGLLPWPVAFASCFLGIWLGDLWLYGMARVIGAPAIVRYGNNAAIARSREWFKQRGSLVLLAVRFVPGLRLPGYLAAGAMRFPVRAFVIVTGFAAMVWVGGIFALGTAGAGWLALGAVAVIAPAAASRLWKKTVRRAGRRSLHFEFWPSWIFYAPVALFYAWLGVRYRGLNLPAAANPGMPAGGLVGESKFDTLRLLGLVAPAHTAATWVLAPQDPPSRFATLREIIERNRVELPFILKPDIGQRGSGVKLIRSLDAAADYLAHVDAPVLLQRYAPGPLEAGVFYYRLPDEPHGHILAITRKIFPTIEGDGERTVEDLILAGPRSAIIAGTYLRRFEKERRRVLKYGEALKLVEAGNHAQGCIFCDGKDLATPELLAAFDRISRSLPGFFIGRYDVRYASDDDLRAGRNFTIVELNGAGSEATSIYDARMSPGDAYRMLYKQWELVFRIGAMNRASGCPAEPLSALLRAWWRTIQMTRSYPVAD
jgi:membrane protein DedA with SNARE-associated domain